jgi:hypothetical protein
LQLIFPLKNQNKRIGTKCEKKIYSKSDLSSALQESESSKLSVSDLARKVKDHSSVILTPFFQWHIEPTFQ